jgi:sulfonate transport system permease protein
LENDFCVRARDVTAETVTQEALPAPSVDERLAAIVAKKRRRAITVWIWRGVILVLVLATWQFASGHLFPKFVVSSPSQVGERLWDWISNGYLPRNLGVTLEETAIGFSGAVLVGSLAGILIGVSQYLSDITSPFVNGLYALPKIMLGPLFVVWFGIGMELKMVLSGVFAVFIIFYNIWSGVQEVNRDLVDMFRLMGAKRRSIVTGLYLPSALTWLFMSLRLAFPLSLIGAIVGEFIASNNGVGYVVLTAADTYDTAGVFATVIVVMITCVVVDQAIVHIQRIVNLRLGGNATRQVI